MGKAHDKVARGECGKLNAMVFAGSRRLASWPGPGLGAPVPEADWAFWPHERAAPHKCPPRWPEAPRALGQSLGIRMRVKARVVCLGRSSGPERGDLFGLPIRGRWRWSHAMARTMACALVLWVATWSGTPAAEADTAVRVFAIRGVAGMLFSRGMNALCDELAELASVTCTVQDFTEVTAIESEARAASAAGAYVVLVGHSMGADAAIEIATQIAGPIAVVAAIDPPRFAPVRCRTMWRWCLIITSASISSAAGRCRQSRVSGDE
jgi:hypothetical protein